MTKKHIEKLTAALSLSRPNIRKTVSMSQWVNDVEAVADVCAAENPNFDRERFYTACGM